MTELGVAGVWKRYGKLDVLQDINLSVESGEFVVLVGPSGCGKSTLLSIVAGLDNATQGHITIGGRSVDGLSARDRDIAMVFQSYALYPTMTVRKNITFGMRCRGVPKVEQEAALAEACRVLQIGHLLDRRPAQLSGGQRQRVAMGRALVRNPSLFLFDEPLSNLDAKLRVDMRMEIKRLHARVGTTMLYVTHDQVEAMTLATRIAVLNNGRVQQFADPDTIYDDPANLFVARFMGAPPMNTVPAQLIEIGPQLVARIGGHDTDTVDMPLPDHVVGRQHAGRSVILGIRPECISSGGPAAPSTTHARLRAQVDLVEVTGADTIVLLTAGGATMLSRLGPAIRPRVGEPFDFIVDLSKACLFDPQTEERLR